ncbi:MAG TPA: hypothetical protein PK370_03265 [Candidatus Woesebacteria bacterium]|nr:hypothetical protein [Candidatus Woesebacteria bacterium]
MSKNTLAVWNVKESQFPTNGSLKQKIKFLVRYGILAPSTHNSQPWKFLIDDNSLEILPDFERSLGELDPDNRELYISLGAAAKNVEIAADYFGMIFKKDVLKFSFENGKKESGKNKLFKGITLRRTDRGDFLPKQIDKNIFEKMEGVMVVDQKEMKQKLAQAVYESDIVWFKSKKLLTELEYWLHKGGTANLLEEIKKMSEDEITKSLRNKKMVEEAPLLAVIYSKDEVENDWVKSGERFEEISLKLAINRISTGFFNSIIELETQRKKLIKLLGIKGQPQLLLRIGVAVKSGEQAPRRSVKEVIISSR